MGGGGKIIVLCVNNLLDNELYCQGIQQLSGFPRHLAVSNCPISNDNLYNLHYFAITCHVNTLIIADLLAGHAESRIRIIETAGPTSQQVD